jgi:hypothetical protein
MSGRGRARTCDLRLVEPTLSLLSYAPLESESKPTSRVVVALGTPIRIGPLDAAPRHELTRPTNTIPPACRAEREGPEGSREVTKPPCHPCLSGTKRARPECPDLPGAVLSAPELPLSVRLWLGESS